MVLEIFFTLSCYSQNWDKCNVPWLDKTFVYFAYSSWFITSLLYIWIIFQVQIHLQQFSTGFVVLCKFWTWASFGPFLRNSSLPIETKIRILAIISAVQLLVLTLKNIISIWDYCYRFLNVPRLFCYKVFHSLEIFSVFTQIGQT